jgi:DNA primase
VFVCEGEKDADRLAGLGLVATTRAEGAGKWTDANSRWLEGRRVAILGDNDAAGAKDVDRKVRSIGQAASAVAVVDLAELPEGGDVSDWLDAGKTKDDLVALAEMAMGATPSAEPRTSRRRRWRASRPRSCRRRCAG